MEKIETEDGSYTFYSEEFKQHYHTLSGAFGEALKKHVQPALDYFSEGCVILDFCFGLGYNSFVAINEARKKKVNVKVIALENDLEIIQKLEGMDLGELNEIKKDFLEVIKVEPVIQGKIKVYKKENFILLLGDAQDSLDILHEFSENISVTFFDPFSRSVCPVLWKDEIFQEVFNCMKHNSILTTYSCSKVVRRSMKSAGFEVKDGPVFGRIAPGTIAFKH